MLALVVRHTERKCKTLTRNTCVISKSFVSIVFKVLYGYTYGYLLLAVLPWYEARHSYPVLFGRLVL